MDLSLVTFSTPNFNYSKKLLLRSARQAHIRSIFSYTKKDFQKTSFFSAHSDITLQPRGAGYWLWKPFYILEHLKKAKDGDIILYCDAGVSILKNLDPLVDICLNNQKNQGVLLFKNYQGALYIGPGFEKTDDTLYNEALKNKYWGKRDVFVLMELDEEKYWNSPQVEGCILLFKKTDFSVKFVTEWLEYCCDENIVTDKSNTQGKPNFDNFIMHIHDQVVLSLLAAKYDLELFRCPSQHGNHKKLEEFRKKEEYLMLPYTTPEMNSSYDTLFLHHRIKRMPFIQQTIFDIKVFVKRQFNKIGIDW